MGLNPLAKVTGRNLNIFITIASTCGFLLFGYDNGVFSGIIVNPWFLKTFHKPSGGLLGTISAMYNIGGLIGSAAAFLLGDALGRRKTILCGVAVTTIGAMPFSAATNIGTLVAGRIVCGIGVGMMTSTVGIWQAETTPSLTRGRYLVVQLLGGAGFGLFLSQWINYGFYANTGRAGFAFPVAFQLVFLLLSGVLVTLLPESPRWLVKKDRVDEAVAILHRLSPNSEEAVQNLLAQIIETDALEKASGSNQYALLFTNGPTQNFRRLCLACGVMIMHQLGGINSITYYLPTLLVKFIGATHKESLWIAGLSSVDSMICAIIPVITIDRLGRRGFLFYGCIFQTVMFVIIAALLGSAPAKNHSYGIAAVVMLFIFYGGNSACWLGPSWAYPAEILPLQIREKGLALGNCCYWAFQFMMVEITPIAIDNIYYKFYIILAALNVFNAVCIFVFYPETARKSLEELDFFFVEKYGGGQAQVAEIERSIGKRQDGFRVEHVSDKGLSSADSKEV